ncbi:unnamed protein product [Sordaria macrospora k-hell]|uniref:WGS project CABT00000000 data, contig 2.41 n=1 Tax=Sordaria macrospora (strain ATCC MYA-333 / DSM 997 / K(L3346) / K-hell) TaxID=771870 RepID=F7W7Z8_SORMK|nr:unnamed protein product [Sordaria macrospora k-hell]
MERGAQVLGNRTGSELASGQ